jgi:hypothetical protein
MMNAKCYGSNSRWKKVKTKYFLIYQVVKGTWNHDPWFLLIYPQI